MNPLRAEDAVIQLSLDASALVKARAIKRGGTAANLVTRLTSLVVYESEIVLAVDQKISHSTFV